jgi:hypothetical protein
MKNPSSLQIGAERVSLSLAEFITRPQADGQIGAMGEK